MKRLIIFLMVLILMALAVNTLQAPNDIRPVACTEEAKVCPDGSAVGRSGPNCEFAPCPIVRDTSTESGVEGVVTIGPTCPVMREGDTSCADKPYVTVVQVIELGSPKSSPFSTAETNAEGRYKVLLPPGNYALQPIGGRVMPRCETREVTVVSSIMTNVDLSCDSGIR